MKRTRFLSEFGAAAGTQDRVRSMVIYSGTPVYRYDFWTDTEFMLTLSTDPKHVNLSRMANAPLLADHNRSIDRQIGVIENARIDAAKLVGDARFAQTDTADPIWQSVQDGIIRNVSVEAFINQTKDVTKKGDPMRSFLATDWEPQAVAVVPVGADPNATFLSLAEEEQLWLPAEFRRQPERLAETGAASPANTSLSGSNSLLIACLRRALENA